MISRRRYLLRTGVIILGVLLQLWSSRRRRPARRNLDELLLPYRRG